VGSRLQVLLWTQLHTITSFYLSLPAIAHSRRDEVAGLDAEGLLQYAALTKDGFRAWLSQNYGEEHVERMLALYPPSSARVGAEGGACAGKGRESSGCSLYYYLLVTIVSDDAVVCPARNVAQLLPKGMAYQYKYSAVW
jgi:hypothetical protein